MHPNSIALFTKYALKYFRPDMRVLEIGPDNFPSVYQNIIGAHSILWDTVNIYPHPQLTYCAEEEYRYPISDSCYDIVLSSQVLEHVKKIWLWIKELSRVCKPGGLVITINPVSWHYHEDPVDCWRVFPEGMRALYEEAGLKVILSTFESLEFSNYRHYIPGISLTSRPRIYRLANLLMGKLGWPVERSYDTITIGQKMFEV